MLTRLILVLTATLAVASPALAQDGAPPPTDDAAVTTLETDAQRAARANAEWGRRILAGEPSAEGEDTAGKGCVRNPDRKPHGVVWGEVGTGGYKSGGAIVTQPVGDCGSLTIGYEQSHVGNGNIRRSRR